MTGVNTCRMGIIFAKIIKRHQTGKPNQEKVLNKLSTILLTPMSITHALSTSAHKDRKDFALHIHVKTRLNVYEINFYIPVL